MREEGRTEVWEGGYNTSEWLNAKAVLLYLVTHVHSRTEQ